MKKALIILVLYFSFNLYAGEGDKYNCQITHGVFISSEKIWRSKEKNTFTFEWTKDKIYFGKQGSSLLRFNRGKILYSNSLSDYSIDDFIAVFYSYNVDTSEYDIPFGIYNFKNGILKVNLMPGSLGTHSFYANCNRF